MGPTICWEVPTETRSGRRPRQESASASRGSQTQGCQAGPGCARLRVGARASAAACVSGSAAEPPWRSPPALSRCQLLACPRQSPGSAGRALPFRVRLSFLRRLALCARVWPPSLNAASSRWLLGTAVGSRRGPTPGASSPAPVCRIQSLATSRTETSRGSGFSSPQSKPRRARSISHCASRGSQPLAAPDACL